jgi:hypothetical protein
MGNLVRDDGTKKSTDQDTLPNVPLDFLGCFSDFSQILGDITRLIASQALILDKQKWIQCGRDQRFLREATKELLGRDLDPFVYKLDERTLADLLLQVNKYYYETQKTPGASIFKTRVVDIQGGEYCILCGARSDVELHVDHIVPVNVGGRHHLSNMQLLCVDCNTAKGNWRLLGMSVLFQEYGGSEVSKLMRFRKLIESCVNDKGRTVGKCRCGRTSRDSLLTVKRIRPSFAPTYTNLCVCCDMH